MEEHDAEQTHAGQGFFGYNPPDFVLNAAKDALDKVECNQYSPTKVRPSARMHQRNDRLLMVQSRVDHD